MSLIIVPDQMTAKLAAADRPLELCAADGRVLGYFTPAKETGPYQLDPPFSEEELDRAAAEPGGRPLADILRDLEARA